MSKTLSKTTSPLDDFSSPNSRENYLLLADNDYLGARALCLIKLYLPAGVLAQQATEKYLKLKLIEFTTGYKGCEKDREQIFRKCNHDLSCLFQQLFPFMEANSLPLKEEPYYKKLLEQLTNNFKWKYFDEKGLLGALKQKNSIAVGISENLLPRFDELCMELRNAVFLQGLGTTPVNQAIDGVKFWKGQKDFNLSWAFYTENLFAENFEAHEIGKLKKPPSGFEPPTNPATPKANA